MTDHDFEQRLRDWFREEVDETQAAPIALRHSLSVITSEGRHGIFDSRRWMLLAAAALIAMLVAGVAAVGSGLIRLPTPRPAPILLGDCRPTLADELMLSVWRERSGETSVYRDGRVIAAGWVTDSSGAPINNGLQQRRLTPEGVAALLASASDPGLTGCRDVPIDGADDLHVTVREDGSVNEFHTGYGEFSMATADAATTAAATALYQRLMDRNLGMDAHQWADGAWTEYLPDRYVMSVTLPAGVAVPTTSPFTLALPDGSTPVTFGAVMPAADSGGTDSVRCGFVDAGTARAFNDAFAQAWQVDSTRNGGFNVPYWGLGPYSAIEVRAALPQERSCADVYPAPAKAPRRGDPTLAAVDVCALLDGAAMPDEYGDQQRTSVGPGLAWKDADGASDCDFASSDGTVFYRVELRTQATTAAEAEELVRGTFGIGGYREIEIGGRTTYLDACAYAALPCEPAIAISADPYYLLIRGTRQPTAEETSNVLRALATTAIERLGR